MEPGLDNIIDTEYFKNYSNVRIHLDMLNDVERMDTYYYAIFKNSLVFKNKVVLDIGCGTGILSLWAVRAGAQKVYAVDNSNIIQLGKEIIELNNMADKIELIKSKLEDIEILEKVDIIVSEWMGYMLIQESMIDTIIYARDNWLKKNGLILPSYAELYINTINSDTLKKRNIMKNEYINKIQRDLNKFKENYDINIQPILKKYDKQYDLINNFIYDSETVYSDEVNSESKLILSLDLYKININEMKEINKTIEFNQVKGKINGFVLWFKTIFKKNIEKDFLNEYTLSTSPEEPLTHWKHTILPCNLIDLDSLNKLNINIKLKRSLENERRITINLQNENNNKNYIYYSTYQDIINHL